jgi:hypothetical protein
MEVHGTGIGVGLRLRRGGGIHGVFEKPFM